MPLSPPLESPENARYSGDYDTSVANAIPPAALPSPLAAAKTPLPAPQPVPAQQLASPTPGLAGGSRPTPPPIQIVTHPHRRREPQSSVDSSGPSRARVGPNHTSTSGGVATGPGHHGNWRQGKPIFDWISRKLAGARRGSESGNERPQPPPPEQQQQSQQHAGSTSGRASTSNNRAQSRSRKLGYQRHERRTKHSPVESNNPNRNSVDSPYRTESLSQRSYSASHTASERRREANNPYPSLPIPLARRSYPASTLDSGSRAPSISVFTRSRTPSLASLSSHAARRPRISIADDGSTASESFRLAGRVADEDASVRPIPPSPSNGSFISRSGSAPLKRTESLPQRNLTASPPPVIDRRDTMSSSYGASYMSEGSRQESLASTKPTTVMSFESGGTPAHIAVAPPSQPNSPGGITRSTSSPTGVTAASITSQAAAASPVSPSFPQSDTRVPPHSRYHPRNNPHPSAVPRPDASIVTLASSTFAMAPSPIERSERPWDRITGPASLRIRDSASPSAYHPPSAASPTVAFADRPGSMHDGLSTTMSLSVRTRDKYARADEDASVRALRRRGSWESGESRWSWRPAVPGEVFLNRRSEIFAEEDVRGSIYSRDHRALSTWDDEEPPIRPVSVSVSVV